MSSKKEQQDRKQDKDQKRQKEQKERKGPSLLEWISAAIGAALTIGLVTLILLEAVGPSAPVPVLAIRPVLIANERGSYIVRLDVTNKSGETAAALNLEGELRQGGEIVETSTATLSYLPGYSTRGAGLIFLRDPRRFELSVRATGYEVP